MTGDAPADARCPRCGGAFHCGAADAGPCACTGLALSPALLERLRREFIGCLCLRCLRELTDGPPAVTAARHP